MPRSLQVLPFFLLAACSVYDAPGGAGGSLPDATPVTHVAATGTGGANPTGSGGGLGSAGPAGSSGEGGSSGTSPLAAGTGGTAGSLPDAARTSSSSGGSSGSGGTTGSAGRGGALDDAAPGRDGTVDASRDGDDPGKSPTGDAARAPESSTCAGYALQLDGIDDYTLISRMVQDDFTLEAWIKTTTSLPGTWWWEGISLLYANQIDNTNDFGSSILNDKLAFGIGNPNTVIVGTTVITTGKWVHIAATRQRSTGEIQLFVNGTREASQVVPTQLNSLTSQPLLTFGATTLDRHFFKGQVDEIRVFNIVRTEAALRATMNERLAGNEPGLVGYWRFDDGAGNVAIDSSPSAASFVLAGGPTWVPSDAPICDGGF